MSLLADLLNSAFESNRFTRSEGRGGKSLATLTETLIAATDETTGTATAAAILDHYRTLDDDQKLAFFRHLAAGHNLNAAEVRAALDEYEATPSRTSYRAFMTAAEPPRQELIRRLNQVPGATSILVNMRADLLRLGRDEDALMALDLDFRHLFASWFNRGFLVLRPITWESPAHILEKIIAYEAVHAIDSWTALRRRLEPEDRRCFAFFHPAMPDEPLIFVEIALTTTIPSSVQALLEHSENVLPMGQATTAVFYSISNCQAGLQGISFGNSLIKQVAADLSAKLPGLKTFVTLSPVPGLSAWLSDKGHAPQTDEELRQRTAQYLLTQKSGRGLPADPVARFHLGNGAILHAVHARADTSPKGMAESGGIMVNYLYDLGKVSKNHEKFASDGEIASTSQVRGLAGQAAKLSN